MKRNYGCDGCSYFYAEWQNNRYFCTKSAKPLKHPLDDCNEWDDYIGNDAWIAYLEKTAQSYYEGNCEKKS